MARPGVAWCRPIHFPHAALTDEGGDLVGTQPRAGGKGHGFQSMCEGDYKPRRDLVGEVHPPEDCPIKHTFFGTERASVRGPIFRAIQAGYQAKVEEVF